VSHSRPRCREPGEARRRSIVTLLAAIFLPRRSEPYGILIRATFPRLRRSCINIRLRPCGAGVLGPDFLERGRSTVQDSTLVECQPAESRQIPARLSHLQEMIEHAAHLLPSQGPITAFVHHNTLHALEDLGFHEAVRQGSTLYGCEPYLSEDQYRREFAQGRIRLEDIR